MKQYNFDEVIDRLGSNDLKHGALMPRWGRNDLLPLWVADMDFATPDFVVEALKKRLEHPIFGYTMDPEDYVPSIIDWINDHHGWTVRPEWLSFIPGIVKGIGFVVNVFCKADEKVIIQPPVYHPFRITPEENGREVVYNPLKLLEDGRYAMDFDNLEQVCDDKCRVIIISNPHNPAGICWDAETLRRLADFAFAHGLIVVSDEIHSDMALFGHQFIPFASVSEHAAAVAISFGAPTKTFNMAGIVSSYAIVPNPELRKPFYQWLKANELNEPTLFAPIATVAAFRKGEEWRKQMIRYVEENIKFVEEFCRERIPQIKPLRPEASFLVWLNCRDLHLSHDELLDLFIDKAHLALNDGEMFGQGGEGFMRLNVGTPRSVLQQALEQLEKAVKNFTGGV